MYQKIISVAFQLLLIRAVALAGAATINAEDYGFSAAENGIHNFKALQKAVDMGGTIHVSTPGTYKVAGTVYIGDNTSLVFGTGVVLEKSAEPEKFAYVFINKGAATRTYNQHISISGLELKINDVDTWMGDIYGQRGHISFFYVKDLQIDNFRISGLVNGQFAIQVCTFEDLRISDGMIFGKKDGVHLGPGKRFRISNIVFQTGDDAIALVPGDWVSANPEFGDLEDGLIENCTDIPDSYLEGAFAKIVPSGWVDWYPGIKVRHGDAVVSGGRIYRVVAALDDKVYTSRTKPVFDSRMAVLDSINWLLFQKDTIHTAVVRNVIFRDIFLHSYRVPFQLMSYSNKYAHSYYSGAPLPILHNITLDNVYVISDTPRALVSISALCDLLTLKNCTIRNNGILIHYAHDFSVYPPLYINFSNCSFTGRIPYTLVSNRSGSGQVYVKTSGSLEAAKDFRAKIDGEPTVIHTDSDLTGLKR